MVCRPLLVSNAKDPIVTLHVILGAGPVGLTLMQQLVDRGEAVRVVTRRSQPRLPEGVEHVTAAVNDPDQARRACIGAGVVYGCVGGDYQDWPRRWPPLMVGMLAGAEEAGAPFVFADNLYMYGPVDGPLREDLPLTSGGTKPAVRALITRMWQAASKSGRVAACALRASDFYGPGVTVALLGEMVAGAAVQGKTANLLGDPSQPHAFSYVPDFARGLITLGEAGEAIAGEAFHLPNAPAEPVREVVARMYRACGHPPKSRRTPDWLLALLGLRDPNLRELRELLYQWRRPFLVDHAKFARRFWSDATPLDTGIAATMDWYRRRG
jgi:nucleoside-diphosphate-sugar epimerase